MGVTVGGSGILVRAGQRVGTWESQTTNYILRSSTKSFGAVLLGLALKDGKVGLDTVVQPMLPELGVPQSTAKATAWLSRITVRHLASHVSGFGRWKTTQILPATFPDLEGRPADGLSNLPCQDPDPKKCPGATKQYGILLWTNGDDHVPNMPHNAYWAVGQGTSFILVILSLDIVAARAGPEWTGPSNVHLMDPFFTLVSDAVNH